MVAVGLGKTFDGISHLLMATIFSSVISGATALNGGLVVYPMLYAMYETPIVMFRDFGFVVQGVGGALALVFILAGRIPVEWRAVSVMVMPGGVGTLVSMLWLEKSVSTVQQLVLLSSMWLGFAVGYIFVIMRQHRRQEDRIGRLDFHTRVELMVVALVGGLLTGISGGGVGTLVFAVLSLYYGVKEQVAVPTSVVVS